MEMNNDLEDLEFELFEKIKNIPYVKLLERYIKNYNEDKLFVMAMQYLSKIPEDVQINIVKIIEIHFFSSYTLNKLDADCENALILILQNSDMAYIADKYMNNKLDEEEKQFMMTFFRVITLSHAHLASKNKELRKLLGIKKGLFFR